MKENLNNLDLNTGGAPPRDFINLKNQNQNASTLLVSSKKMFVGMKYPNAYVI